MNRAGPEQERTHTTGGTVVGERVVGSVWIPGTCRASSANAIFILDLNFRMDDHPTRARVSHGGFVKQACEVDADAGSRPVSSDVMSGQGRARGGWLFSELGRAPICSRNNLARCRMSHHDAAMRSRRQRASSSILPARRAARVDPVEALRAE
jgi:uncharacterized protein (DUF362 family)